jgi:hypothetical protein
MKTLYFNIPVTQNNKPLFFEQLSEDGWGRYVERDWEYIEDSGELPLVVSDYVVEKYPVGFNVISRIFDINVKEIDKKTLKIAKYKLELIS